MSVEKNVAAGPFFPSVVKQFRMNRGNGVVQVMCIGHSGLVVMSLFCHETKCLITSLQIYDFQCSYPVYSS